nr:MAG TPA: hypothetical protein [Caudoviricetes sp.]
MVFVNLYQYNSMEINLPVMRAITQNQLYIYSGKVIYFNL